MYRPPFCDGFPVIIHCTQPRQMQKKSTLHGVLLVRSCPTNYHLTSRIPQSRVFRKSKLVDRPRDLTSHYSIIGIVLPSMPLAANTQGLHVREQSATHNKSTTLARLFWDGTAVVDW